MSLTLDGVLVKECADNPGNEVLVDLPHALAHKQVEDRVDLVVVRVRDALQKLAQPPSLHSSHSLQQPLKYLELLQPQRADL